MNDTNKNEMKDWWPVTQTLPMTCRHSPEGLADADAVLGECQAGLEALGYTDPGGQFLSAIVTSLEHDFGGWFVDHIACDMWFGAAIRRYQVSEGVAVPGQRLSTQGDSAEDCLATLWLEARRLYEAEEVSDEGSDPAEG